MRVLIKFLILCTVLIFINTELQSQILYNNEGHIPQGDQVEWTNAGLLSGTPTMADNVFYIDTYSGTDDQKVQAALDDAKAASGTSLIYFPKGTYQLYQTIELEYDDDPNLNCSNIIFQGEGTSGVNATILEFLVGKNNKCFHIHGQSYGYKEYLTQNVDKGDTVIHGNWAAPPSGPFENDDWVQLIEYSFPKCRDRNYTLLTDKVGQITQLTSVGTNTAVMRYEASKYYSTSYDLYVQKILPITNVGIENLKIVRKDSDPASSDKNGSNIYFNFAVNCWIKGVESDQTCKYHIYVSKSCHLEISGCYFHDARFHGGGGYGYGVVMGSSSTNCLVENNIFKTLRHSMGIVEGANCNAFTYNLSRDQYSTYNGVRYPDSDLCLHGKYSYANLYEHNYVEWIEADNEHYYNGPYNAFVRNICYDHDDGGPLDETGWSSIDLHYAPTTAVLGNQVRFDPTDPAVIAHGDGDPPDETSYSIEVYGFDGSGGYSHNQISAPFAEYLFLQDVSYYYSSAPDFVVDEGVQFPTVGPKASGYGDPYITNHYIPACFRYNSSNKTYLPDPTLRALTTGGTLNYNETWFGTHTLTDNVTVPSGITLTIQPGTIVEIPANRRITVEGTLIAQGTASEYITFKRSGSSSWYGIKFEDSSNDQECILQYCTIQGASYGAYCYKASPRILNCTIQNNSTGIYSGYATAKQDIKDNNIYSNSFMGVFLSSVSEVDLHRNEIHHSGSNNVRCYNVNGTTDLNDNDIHHNDGGDGIYLFTASPSLLRNSIYYHSRYGIYCYDDSSPELFNGSDPGKNVVAYNTSYGVYIDSSSFAVLGGELDNEDQNADNSYYSNATYDVYSLAGSQIDATYCYWGGTPRVYGSVDTDNALSENPNPDPHTLLKPLANSSVNSPAEMAGDSRSSEESRKAFQEAFDYERKKLYDAAIEKYQSVIDKYPETIEAELALVRKSSCYNKSKRSDAITSFMDQVATEHSKQPVGGRARVNVAARHVREGDYESALAGYSGVIEDFAGFEMAKVSLFNKWQIYFDGMKDMDNAKSTMTEFEKRYPDDELLVIMKTAMGEWGSVEVKQFLERLAKGKGEEELASSGTIPEKFAVFQNYPNPFNPETTIRYTLPEAGRVMLKIYDLRGREVVTLLNADQPAGMHTLTWNSRDRLGREVASGVYFYRLDFEGQVKSGKMILMR